MESKLKLFVLAAACSIHFSDCAITASQRQELLDAHNMYRKGVEPSASDMLQMVWNDELAQTAQNWADQCQFHHNLVRASLSPSFDSVGENIGFTTNLNEHLTATVRRWHDEIQHYTYPNVCSDVCGHYTQVVWAKSEHIGCGIHRKCQYDDSTGMFLVCNYGPAGNIQGQEPYQKGAVCSNCPSGYTCQNQLCNKSGENGDGQTGGGSQTEDGGEQLGGGSQTGDGGEQTGGGNQTGDGGGQLGGGSQTGDGGGQTGGGSQTGDGGGQMGGGSQTGDGGGQTGGSSQTGDGDGQLGGGRQTGDGGGQTGGGSQTGDGGGQTGGGSQTGDGEGQTRGISQTGDGDGQTGGGSQTGDGGGQTGGGSQTGDGGGQTGGGSQTGDGDGQTGGGSQTGDGGGKTGGGSLTADGGGQTGGGSQTGDGEIGRNQITYTRRIIIWLLYRRRLLSRRFLHYG